MTEYTAVCETFPHETMTVGTTRDTSKVKVRYTDGDHEAGSLFLSPDKAREFAAAIVAQADELDGSKAADSLPIKVGDKVRVLEDFAFHADVSRGDVFTVLEMKEPRDVGQDWAYAVDDGDDGRWVFRIRDVERVVDEEASSAVKVGDKLRVTKDRLHCAGVSPGDVLTVRDTDDCDGFSARDERGIIWGFDNDHIGNGLVRVSDEEPAADAAFGPGSLVVIPDAFPERVTLLTEANKHIAQPARAEDVLAVARFLAGE